MCVCEQFALPNAHPVEIFNDWKSDQPLIKLQNKQTTKGGAQRNPFHLWSLVCVFIPRPSPLPPAFLPIVSLSYSSLVFRVMFMSNSNWIFSSPIPLFRSPLSNGSFFLCFAFNLPKPFQTHSSNIKLLWFLFRHYSYCSGYFSSPLFDDYSDLYFKFQIG